MREIGNVEDRYAVIVIRGSTMVGHVPRKISAAYLLFLQRKGSIQCVITGARCYSSDLPQGGLEVPCVFKFRGHPNDMSKVGKLLQPTSEK